MLEKLFKSEKAEVVPERVDKPSVAAAGLPPSVIESARTFQDVEAEMNVLRARQLVAQQEQPTLRAAVDLAQASYRQELVTDPDADQQVLREAQQALDRSVHLEAGLESAIVVLRPVWARAKVVALRSEITALERTRATREASAVRLDGEITRLQGERYQLGEDVIRLAEQLGRLRTEVGVLWREAQPGPPTPAEKG